MKVAVLWTRPSGYWNVVLRALVSHGCEILVVNEASGSDAPFDSKELEWIKDRYEFAGAPEVNKVFSAVESFGPDVILCSWHVALYQRVCLRLKGRAVRVGCGDNQWRGTLKQHLGRLAAPFHIRRFYDVFFAAGERQAAWARKMGFDEERIWQGLYVCDVVGLAKARELRSENARGFVYAGRLSPEKGVRVLAEAYGLYRQTCRDAWPLIVVGDGPIRNVISNIPGIDWRGFIQPHELPDVLGEARCFVMPSTFDPWCVALHEAASAGMPLIATSACGAAVHLVQGGYNGCVVTPGSAVALAEAMNRMTRKSAQELAEMGRRSFELSNQFSPERFAKTVLERGNELLAAAR